MIISFAWTVGPLVEGLKKRTSRDWSDRHLAAWQRAWDEGRLVHEAWDKGPRAGGKRIGQIRLTQRPRRERLGDVTLRDLIAEGSLWGSIEEFIELMGGDPEKRLAVVWFEWMGA